MAESSAADESFFPGEGGVKLFYRNYRASPEKARIVIAHGLGEHSGRYGTVVERLLPEGISVWALDHRGHGQSEGSPGHTFSFYQYVVELSKLVEIARDGMAEGVRIFLLGHSLGGLIGLRFVSDFPGMIHGLIVSSPALGLASEITPARVLAGKVISALCPTFSFANGLDVSKISHDENVVREYIEDPLVHNRISARLFTEFLLAMEAAGQAASKITNPVLMQLAGEDYLTSMAASVNFFEVLGSNDKTLQIYEGLYHEIYNETAEQRKGVLDDLSMWLQKRI